MPTTTLDVSILKGIAKICHQANKAYCEFHNDNTQKDWEDAEEWQRESAISGVLFRINNPDAPASAQHEAWMADKVKDGWQYGEQKDPIAKTHPCIVPYDELPVYQRTKDKLFQAIVDVLK